MKVEIAPASTIRIQFEATTAEVTELVEALKARKKSKRQLVVIADLAASLAQAVAK